MLRTSGLEEDLVVMFQMYTKSKHDALIFKKEEWLRACGVKIKYLPRMNSEEADSFYSGEILCRSISQFYLLLNERYTVFWATLWFTTLFLLFVTYNYPSPSSPKPCWTSSRFWT